MTGSHLILRPATAQEVYYVHELNAAAWAGALDVETYHDREQTLASTPLTRNGGLSTWVLVDPADDPHKILSSCETTKKQALISTPRINGDTVSTVRQVTAHGVGSVFTPEEHRGKGYAGTMLQLLAESLKRGNASYIVGCKEEKKERHDLVCSLDLNRNSMPGLVGNRTSPRISNFLQSKRAL